MRSSARCVGALLLAFAATACQRAAPDTWVSSASGSLKLRLPGDWKVEKQPASTLFARPWDGDERVAGVYVVVGHDVAQGAPDAPGLADYIEFKDTQAEAAAQWHQVSEQRELQLDGAPAVLRITETVMRQDSRKSVMLLTVRKSGGWIVVGAAPVEGFAQWRPVLERIVQSVDWHDE